jgi:hypothetical protein
MAFWRFPGGRRERIPANLIFRQRLLSDQNIEINSSCPLRIRGIQKVSVSPVIILFTIAFMASDI